MADVELIDEISPRDRQREKELSNKKQPISYTGIVLDDRSKERIIKELDDLIPDDWEPVIHHMTVNMGEAKPEHVKYLNFPINLYGTHVGMNNNAMAIAVDGFDSDNETPHITVAINKVNGGKPKDSKTIDEWKPLRRKLRLKGYLEEVPFKL